MRRRPSVRPPEVVHIFLPTRFGIRNLDLGFGGRPFKEEDNTHLLYSTYLLPQPLLMPQRPTRNATNNSKRSSKAKHPNSSSSSSSAAASGRNSPTPAGVVDNPTPFTPPVQLPTPLPDEEEQMRSNMDLNRNSNANVEGEEEEEALIQFGSEPDDQVQLPAVREAYQALQGYQAPVHEDEQAEEGGGGGGAKGVESSPPPLPVQVQVRRAWKRDVNANANGKAARRTNGTEFLSPRLDPDLIVPLFLLRGLARVMGGYAAAALLVLGSYEGMNTFINTLLASLKAQMTDSNSPLSLFSPFEVDEVDVDEEPPPPTSPPQHQQQPRHWTAHNSPNAGANAAPNSPYGSLSRTIRPRKGIPVPIGFTAPSAIGYEHEYTYASGAGSGASAQERRRQVREEQEFEREYEREEGDFGWGVGGGRVVDLNEDLEFRVNAAATGTSRGSGTGSGLAQAMRREHGHGHQYGYGMGERRVDVDTEKGARVDVGAGKVGGDREREGERERRGTGGKEVVAWSRWDLVDGRRILIIAYHQQRSTPTSSNASGPGLQIYDCTDLTAIQEILDVNLDGPFLPHSAADQEHASRTTQTKRTRTRTRRRMKIVDVAVLPADEEEWEGERPMIGVLLENVSTTTTSSSVSPEGGGDMEEELMYGYDGRRQPPPKNVKRRTKTTERRAVLALYSLRTHRVVKTLDLPDGRCSTTSPPAIRLFSTSTFELVHVVQGEEVKPFLYPLTSTAAAVAHSHSQPHSTSHHHQVPHIGNNYYDPRSVRVPNDDNDDNFTFDYESDFDDDDDGGEQLAYPVFALHGRLLAYAASSPGEGPSVGGGAALRGHMGDHHHHHLRPTSSSSASKDTTSKEIKEARRLSSASATSSASGVSSSSAFSFSGGLGVLGGKLSSLAGNLSLVGMSPISAPGESGGGAGGVLGGTMRMLGGAFGSGGVSVSPTGRFVSRSAPDEGSGRLGLGGLQGMDQREQERERVVVKPSSGISATGGGGGPYWVKVVVLGGVLRKTKGRQGRTKTVAHFVASRSQPVSLLEFTPDGLSLGVGSRDGRWVKVFRLWPVPGVASSSPSPASPQVVSSVSTSSTSSSIPEAINDPRKTYELFRGHTNARVHAISFTPSGLYAGLATENGTLHVFAVNPPQVAGSLAVLTSEEEGAAAAQGEVQWYLEGRVRGVEGGSLGGGAGAGPGERESEKERTGKTSVRALVRLRVGKTAPSGGPGSGVGVSPISPSSPTSTYRRSNQPQHGYSRSVSGGYPGGLSPPFYHPEESVGTTTNSQVKSKSASAPLAFTFLSHADLASAPSLLPSSSSASYSSGYTASSPRSAGSAQQQPSSRKNKNFQDVLIFDPVHFVLSLRRINLEKRRASGVMSIGGGISSLTGGIGNSLSGIGIGGGITAMGGGGIGNSLGGIGENVVNAMTSISLPKSLSTLSSALALAPQVVGSSSAVAGGTTAGGAQGKERWELGASESVVKTWSLGRSGLVPFEEVKVPVEPLPSLSSRGARRRRMGTAANPSTYLAQTEISTHFSPPSSSNIAVRVGQRPNTPFAWKKSIYLAHQFTFSTFSHSSGFSAGGGRGDNTYTFSGFAGSPPSGNRGDSESLPGDYHALIRSYAFEALQAVGGRVEVRKEVPVRVLGYPSAFGQGEVQEEGEEGEFVLGREHRRSASTSSASARAGFLSLATMRGTQEEDPLASAIEDSLGARTSTSNGMYGLEQAQLPAWPNGAPGRGSGAVIQIPIREIGEGLGRIGKSARRRLGGGDRAGVGAGGREKAGDRLEFGEEDEEDEEEFARIRGEIVDMDADVLGTVDEELWDLSLGGGGGDGGSGMGYHQEPLEEEDGYRQHQHHRPVYPVREDGLLHGLDSSHSPSPAVSEEARKGRPLPDVELEGYDDLEVERASAAAATPPIPLATPTSGVAGSNKSAKRAKGRR
ncbi:hypothetical protein D9613_011234 [Agrocybe pediades]|uniref:Uncharacterized protein n=1 Tax=Agrocybe pediades TaxID=84607 RepID=A0A8H4QSU8_9AGAR|nr:hypothetical protein D9613_011234 [Agrocybe pediades]